MLTMKIYEGENGVFKNTDDAIKYMIETNFEDEVTIYDIDSNKAYSKTRDIYKAIKEYNNGKSLNIQILPSYPFEFRGIVGCLGVQAYSISLGTYEKNHQHVALFTGWNNSVLDESDEVANVRPGLKALTSLAMMAEMMCE